MNNFIRTAAALVTKLAILTLCQCSNIDLAGGNSSQTGNNGIVLAAKSQSITGIAQPHSPVFIFSKSYMPYEKVPGTCDSTVADMRGNFAFDTVPAGHYNLIAYDSARVRGAFIGPIPVYMDSVFSAKLPSLPRPGFATGIAMDPTGKSRAFSCAFISGSPFYTVANQNGEFLLGPLPVGNYTIRFIENFAVTTVSPFRSVVPDTGMVTVFSDSITVFQ
jgi:hypothetical protein